MQAAKRKRQLVVLPVCEIGEPHQRVDWQDTHNDERVTLFSCDYPQLSYQT